eukprot:scaffold630_cov174-Amphora_coffeaeformis.AAC.29
MRQCAHMDASTTDCKRPWGCCTAATRPTEKMTQPPVNTKVCCCAGIHSSIHRCCSSCTALYAGVKKGGRVILIVVKRRRDARERKIIVDCARCYSVAAVGSYHITDSFLRRCCYLPSC